MTIHVGEIGIYLRLSVTDENGSVLDVSACSEIEIFIRSPDGTNTTKIASYTTDGTDGKIEYQTQADDIDEEGRWWYQGHLVWGTGVDLVSTEAQFRAVDPLIPI